MQSKTVRELRERLSVMPVRLRALRTNLSESSLRAAPPDGGFARIENAWHLRDIEVEGCFPRIRRILAEDNPALPSIGGDRLSQERRYLERDLAAALDEFAQFSRGLTRRTAHTHGGRVGAACGL